MSGTIVSLCFLILLELLSALSIPFLRRLIGVVNLALGSDHLSLFSLDED